MRGRAPLRCRKTLPRRTWQRRRSAAHRRCRRDARCRRHRRGRRRYRLVAYDEAFVALHHVHRCTSCICVLVTAEIEASPRAFAIIRAYFYCYGGQAGTSTHIHQLLRSPVRLCGSGSRNERGAHSLSRLLRRPHPPLTSVSPPLKAYEGREEVRVQHRHASNVLAANCALLRPPPCFARAYCCGAHSLHRHPLL